MTGGAVPEPHLIVVGGTGMLRSATVALGPQAQAVTLVARTASRLSSVAGAIGGERVVMLGVDYTDDATLARSLDEQTTTRGPFTLAVCWIHGTAPAAPATVARRLSPTGGRFFHVLPHTAADPAVAERLARPIRAANPGIVYRTVVLGSVMDGGGRRWLTHDEISRGVLDAVSGDTDVVVGDLDDRA